jgi:mannitol-specific phosphotransferase system IIBC component
MNRNNIDIHKEIWRVNENATARRVALSTVAGKNARRRKALSFSAGLLSLVSAGYIITVIANYTSPEIIQILAAVLATLAGVIILLSTLLYKDSELIMLHQGSTKYLNLRDRAYHIMINNGLNVRQKHHRIKDLIREYSELDGI